MEDKELQKIWKTMDSEIQPKTKDELSLLLSSKARQTINHLQVITGISIVISVGFLVYLTITSLNRKEDMMFLMINTTLGVLTAIAFISGVISWRKLHFNPIDQPLKKWLEKRISSLTIWLTGRLSKLYRILIPVIYILTTLSIHVYFQNKPLWEVLKTEESLIGLLVGIPIGLGVAFFVVRKIRKYQIHQLEFLKDLHIRLCKQ